MRRIKLSPGQKQILAGLIAVVSQVGAIGYIYWLIKVHLGIEQLGIWSLLFSVLSIVNISGFGIGQTMVHFAQVAKRDTTEPHAFERYFRTAVTLTMIGFVIFGAIALFPAFYFSVDLVGDDYDFLIADLIPIILMSLFASLINRVTQSTLTGQGFFWIGQISVLLGSIVYVLIAFYLIDHFGLWGVALGHFGMSTTTLLLSWIAICCIRLRETKTYSVIFPFGIYRYELKKMISMGISFQFTSLLMIFIEPFTRFSIGYSGGLSLVGYYEMANRLVVTPRELVARPATYLAGLFSENAHNNPEGVRSLYILSLKRLSVFGVMMIVSLTIFVIPVADYWVGERHWFFFFCVAALGGGWSVSVPALASWNWGIGIGDNQFNLKSTLLISIGCVFSGSLAVLLESAALVPIGTGAALIIGQIYLLSRVSYQILN